MTENLLSFTTVNPAAVDALVRANRAVAHGFEQLSKQTVETVRQSIEEGLQIQRRFAGAGNLTELTALQSQIAQETWQSVWNRGREWSDLNASIAREMVAAFSDGGVEPPKAQKRAA